MFALQLLSSLIWLEHIFEFSNRMCAFIILVCEYHMTAYFIIYHWFNSIESKCIQKMYCHNWYVVQKHTCNTVWSIICEIMFAFQMCLVTWTKNCIKGNWIIAKRLKPFYKITYYSFRWGIVCIANVIQFDFQCLNYYDFERI